MSVSRISRLGAARRNLNPYWMLCLTLREVVKGNRCLNRKDGLAKAIPASRYELRPDSCSLSRFGPEVRYE
jgi:hypothetical protein